nr:ABC-three component system protein [uncultured Flavobacterium sp.]
MSTAKGPSSGYIYQFEIALWQLSSLEDNQSISIESIDDIGKLDEKGTYIATIQAKHSISSSGKSFGNTSEDLWKTLNIWIKNIRDGKLTSDNKFYANSNKKPPKNSIIEKLGKISFDELLAEIESIKATQKLKIEQNDLKGEDSPTIKKTISRIDNTLLYKKELKIISQNFELLDENIDVKSLVFNKMNLGGYSDNQKDNFYHTFLGWVQDKSKQFWINGSDAIFSKKEYDIKFNSLRDIHLLNKLIFRKKDLLENGTLIDPQSINKDQTFIKQILDIDRFQKNEIVEEAIIDYLCRDIEIAHLINSSSPLTREDFKKFEENCIKKWKNILRKHITKPKIQDYTIEELNQISITIYDEVMTSLNMSFQDDFGIFNDSNKYIQNGTFLSLSDVPVIGWHPEWERKYK